MAKAVTLKNNDNEDIYPVTNIDLVNGEVPTSKLANGAVTTAKITDLSVTGGKLADGSITKDKIDYSTFGATWSGFYFTGVQESRDVVVTTKKGTQLTLRISNGGTAVRVVAGGGNINVVRQYWRATYGSSITDKYGLIGCASGATITCRYTNWLSSGTSSNGGVIATTATTGTSGDCYGDLASISQGKIATFAQTTYFSLGNNGWACVGEIDVNGANTLFHHDTVVTSATGYIPAVYQRGANTSTVTSCYNYIEILEA